MLGKIWVKMSVTMYVFCIVTYNLFGKATTGWTDFYYTFEKGFAFLSTMWYTRKPTISDRLFIDFARITQCGTWIFFIVASFNEPLWVYHQTFLITILIVASFGSTFVNHYLIKQSRL